jgi:hypothetical protein
MDISPFTKIGNTDDRKGELMHFTFALLACAAAAPELTILRERRELFARPFSGPGRR